MVNLKRTTGKPAKPANPLAWARFALAAHRLDQLPADQGREVAVAGRSNAGKSSAINAITGQSGLARTSKTPGRTQQLVVFTLDDQRRLVDLPGYGYAQVAQTLREHWRQTLDRYFNQRRALCGLLLAMDVRHPFTPFDQGMLAFAAARGLPCHVLMTKADKLRHGALTDTVRRVTRELGSHHALATAQPFSAVTHDGVDRARAVLGEWLDI
jgi:GTP-binding protein